jgi:hypothetical protein
MYIALNSDLKIGVHQFEIGKTYESEEEFDVESCMEMQDCFYKHDINPRICEVIAEDIVDSKGQGISRKITIIRELDKQEIMDRITDSEYAYWWARHIGNQEVMIDRVTDSEYAYMWALHIGNQEVMIDRVTDSYYAYVWARFIGNKDVMIDRVTDSEYAYRWAIEIGNKDVMIDRITDDRQRKEIGGQIKQDS